MSTSTTSRAPVPTTAHDWRTVNISPTERAGRIILGLAAVNAAVLAVTLEVLLLLAGLDRAVTGTIGHCPLYAKLGHVPRKLRSPR